MPAKKGRQNPEMVDRDALCPRNVLMLIFNFKRKHVELNAPIEILKSLRSMKLFLDINIYRLLILNIVFNWLCQVFTAEIAVKI